VDQVGGTRPRSYAAALSLVLAGDICYRDVHQWLVEATSGCLHRRPGIDCGSETGYRDRASHERPGAVHGISNVRASMDYIRAFGELKETAEDDVELCQAMVRRCPDRVVLWLGCQANH